MFDSKTFHHKQTGYVLEGKRAGQRTLEQISPSDRPLSLS